MPKTLSSGEEELAMHLGIYKIAFEREFQFARSIGRRWRSDFFVTPDLLVEVDGGTWNGGRHSTGKGYAEDCSKLNSAVCLGYRTLRFTPEMIHSGNAIDTIRKAIGPATT